jgi:hypothetical protein
MALCFFSEALKCPRNTQKARNKETAGALLPFLVVELMQFSFRAFRVFRGLSVFAVP